MSVMLGALIGLGMLASRSELVVMQAAGLSRWNIIVSALKSVIFMVYFNSGCRVGCANHGQDGQ